MSHNNCGIVFELILENGELVEIREREMHTMTRLSAKDTKTAREFVEKNYKKIVEKWVNFFVLKKVVRCTKVKNKI